MRTALLLLLLLVPAVTALDMNNAQLVLGPGDRTTLNDGFSSQTVTVSDIDPAKPLLVIGGPCANTLWQQYGMTCEEWPYQEGEGMVLSVDSGKTMLIAGTTQQDTERLMRQLFPDLVKEGSDARGTNSTDVETITESDTVMLRDGNDATIRVNGDDVRIQAVSIEGGTLSAMIAGTAFQDLEEGDTGNAGGMGFTVQSIGTDSATLRFSQSALDKTDDFTLKDGKDSSVQIDGERLRFEDVRISDGKLSVSVDGTTYDLREDQTFPVGNTTFMVQRIDNGSADIVVYETG